MIHNALFMPPQTDPLRHKSQGGTPRPSMEIAEVDQWLTSWPTVHAQYRAVITK